jgi:hypothetical protein
VFDRREEIHSVVVLKLVKRSEVLKSDRRGIWGSRTLKGFGEAMEHDPENVYDKKSSYKA